MQAKTSVKSVNDMITEWNLTTQKLSTSSSERMRVILDLTLVGFPCEKEEAELFLQISSHVQTRHTDVWHVYVCVCCWVNRFCGQRFVESKVKEKNRITCTAFLKVPRAARPLSWISSSWSNQVYLPSIKSKGAADFSASNDRSCNNQHF